MSELPTKHSHAPYVPFLCSVARCLIITIQYVRFVWFCAQHYKLSHNDPCMHVRIRIASAMVHGNLHAADSHPDLL